MKIVLIVVGVILLGAGAFSLNVWRYHSSELPRLSAERATAIAALGTRCPPDVSRIPVSQLSSLASQYRYPCDSAMHEAWGADSSHASSLSIKGTSLPLGLVGLLLGAGTIAVGVRRKRAA